MSRAPTATRPGHEIRGGGRRQTCASGTTRSWRSELRLVSLAKSTAMIVITEAIAT